MNTGTIFDIKKYAVHDGPGIRTTIFLKGCPLRCWWCHNPESQRQRLETVEKTVPLEEGHQVREEQTIGRVMSVADVMQEIRKDVIFFDESGGGVTFSGGEPLMQPDFLQALLSACTREDIHTAIDTTGYAPPEVVQAVMPLVDLFLYDLKLMDDDQHRQYTGVSNQRIVDNLRMLSQAGRKIAIRFPVIPGITDTPQNIADLIAFMEGLHTLHHIHLLPFHRIAEGKYQRFHLKNKMQGIEAPSDARMQALKHTFKERGILAKIGG